MDKSDGLNITFINPNDESAMQAALTALLRRKIEALAAPGDAPPAAHLRASPREQP